MTEDIGGFRKPLNGGSAGTRIIGSIAKKDLDPCQSAAQVWPIVLAGGNGRRILKFIHQWVGRPIPKQYCAFIGKRSMLQHTLARADALGHQNHQLTVIADSHQAHAQTQLADRLPGSVLVQPVNRDTLPGIFLPVTHVYARDPNATVVILPSDHFVYPETEFVKWISGTVLAVEELADKVILVGVQADSIELEYGWICPGKECWASSECSVRSVQRFVEKPPHADALSIQAAGGLWNTLVVVAKVRTLWRLGWQVLPEVLQLFERLKNSIGTSREISVLHTIYEEMPARNFSSDLLAVAANRVAVVTLRDILWSDWGRPERIAATLRRINKTPNFPIGLSAA